MKLRYLFIILACFLVAGLVEVPAQTIEPVIIHGPTTTVVCFELSPGVWSCQ